MNGSDEIIKEEFKCVYSQNEWCTFDRMTDEGHVCLSGIQCNGYRDPCPYKETFESIKYG